LLEQTGGNGCGCKEQASAAGASDSCTCEGHLHGSIEANTLWKIYG